MNLKNLFTLAVFLGTVGVFIWGCQNSQPVTPFKNVALSVSVPPTNEVKASLLGVASNELLYRVDGLGHIPIVTGTAGPFSTAASSGSIDFTVNVPAKDSLVLSVQLNDASSNQPLAVGAVGLNMVSAPVTDVVIEMGSVTRTCYTLNFPTVGDIYNPDVFIFSSDNLLGNDPGGLGDLQINYAPFSPTTPLTISGPVTGVGLPITMANVAYLGNGNFVDYDYVPPGSAFQTNSGLAKGAPISVDDIFCIDLLSIPVSVGGGHAWMQVTNTGTGAPSAVGAQFRYRVNSTAPYFGYEQTNADLSAPVSALPVSCNGAW
jgi:hypothetical protein